MPTRRFLVAPSLAHLIRKERSGERIIEGYFPDHLERSMHVHLSGGKGNLVLVTRDPGAAPVEERTEIPHTHAAALLDFAAGKLGYVRSKLPVAGQEIFIDHLVNSEPLDLISVQFVANVRAEAFTPPLWFGPEVTGDARYLNRSIAVQGFPEQHDVELSNLALDTLLDALESRSVAPPLPAAVPSLGAAMIVSPSSISSAQALMDKPSLEGNEKSDNAALQPTASSISNEGAESTTMDLEVDLARELARSLRRRSERNLARARRA
jgi:CYTH domain-containing protein